MSYLETPIQYNYFVNFQNKQNLEFFENDNIHGTFNRRVPEFAYPDFARLVTKSEAEAFQSASAFPVFITDPQHDFSQDLTDHPDQFIEVPIVFLSDIDPNTKYILEHNGTEDELTHLFWDPSKWEQTYGVNETEINFKSFPLNHAANNFGVLYFLMPYNGLPHDDPNAIVEYYTPKRNVPKLLVDVETGGGSTQREVIGEAFRGGSNVPQPRTSYLKMSVIKDNEILGFKNADIDMRLGDVSAKIRVTVFPPLERDLAFDIKTNNVIDTSNGLTQSLSVLEEMFGLYSTKDHQWTVLPTPSSTLNFNSSVTIPANTSVVEIPITFPQPVLRECVMLQMENFDDRSDLKVLNNHIAVALRNHSSSDFSISRDGFRVKMEIFNSTETRSYGTVVLSDSDSIDLPQGEYMGVFEIECFDNVLFPLYYANNQPSSGARKKAERSILYQGRASDDKNNSLSFIKSEETYPLTVNSGTYGMKFKCKFSLMNSAYVDFLFLNERVPFLDFKGNKIPQLNLRVKV